MNRYATPEATPALHFDDPITHLDRPPGIINTKPSPPFARVVGLFDILINSKPAARKDRLDHWFNIWRSNVGIDLYPAMRLILPHKDRERATYGLKEAGIAKAYIGALGLDRHSRDAVRLFKWKQPTKDNQSVGNFPQTVYEVVAARSTVTEGTLSVDDVNDVLDEIATASKEAEYVKLFTRITEKCTPEEQRWIVRIILKDLGISVKESTVLAVFHPDAMDMFNTSSDLKRVCWLLPNQNKRAADAEKQVQLFQAFQPMLCKRGKTLKECVKMIGKQPEGFLMEEKLDGERMQLHKRGNQFFYCSRKGKDYTYLYGATVGEGALTPFVRDAFDARVTDVILDGEMVVWDPSLEKYCNFGNLKTAALDAIRSGKDDAPRPCYKVFDMLYLRSSAGKETHLTEMPLRNRKKTITTLFREIPGRFEFALSKTGKTASDVERMLQEIVEARGEGLVLKTPASKYVLGGRETCWMKVKPEYMDNMGETVDVLVLSGNYGRGWRGGKVSTLVCGVVDDSSTSGAAKEKDGPKRYMSFVRIGTGLTYADYDWINSKPWKPLDRKRIPSWMRVSTASSGTEDVGDVYLEPHESFIVSVKAASITVTDQYACQMTMRFPRCTQIRDDLKLEEVLTYSELVATSLGKRKAEESAAPKKKRKVTTKRQVAALSEHSRGQKIDGERKSDLFEGLTFRIHPDNLSKPPHDKASLEKLVYEEGGDFTQAVTARTQDHIHVYGGTAITPQIKAIIKADEFDVFKPQWILDCVKRGELVHPTRKYYFHATSGSQAREDFGDDYVMEEEDDGEDEDKPEVKVKVKVKREPTIALSDTDDEEEDAGSLATDDPWLKTARPRDEDERKRIRAISSPETDSESEVDNRAAVDETEDEEDEDDGLFVGVKREQTRKVDEGLARRMSGMDVKSEDAESWEVVSQNAKSAAMGEDDDAMEYDEEKIFRHLIFYLDTPDNARDNGLDVKPTSKVSSKDFDATLHLIEDYGGRVTSDLTNPKLTHVVIHEKDKSRRLEIIRLTSKPKRRHIVIPAFVEDCVDEKTLLNEDAYGP